MSNRRTMSFAVELISGPTGTGTVDDFELFYARRALRRLKSLIGRQGLLDLLADEIEQGNAFLREHALTSNGDFKSATTVLGVQGLNAAEFVGWMEDAVRDEPTMLAAQPEHYVTAGQTDGTVHIVENLGPHVCSFFFHFDQHVEWAAGVPELLPESDYPFKKITNLFLQDGTVVGRVLSQFGDTDEGFNANLTVYFPASCPEEISEHHRRHFAVEFSNWVKAAAAARP